MKKSVNLSHDEYERIINGLKESLIILDKYTLQENKKLDRRGIIIHIMDCEIVDKNMSALYMFFLHLEDGEMKEDIISKLPKNYFETEAGKQSVWFDYYDIMM